MQEIGLVESVNSKNNVAKVVFDRKSACDKCGMCIAANGDKMKVYVQVKNSQNAKAGDFVTIAMSDQVVLKAAFIVYIIPIIMISIGLAIFHKYSDAVLVAIVGVGLVLGVVIGIFIDRIIRKKNGFAPKMTGIVSKTEVSGKDESN